MNPTLTDPRRLQVRQVGQSVLTGVLALAMAAVVIASPATRLPSTVDRLSVRNPTVYAVEIDVRGAQEPGWLSLGSVWRDSTQTVEDVLDQGDQWIFRFRYGGEEAGELVLSRAQLRDEGWRVTVPSEVGDGLAREGFPASAR